MICKNLIVIENMFNLKSTKAFEKYTGFLYPIKRHLPTFCAVISVDNNMEIGYDGNVILTL